ncbi:MAG: ABC transporter substrate-binding protein [Candidatus Nitrosothermus koennekii]|nr:MAG: ABC transporter substrate-binding protein [Candidatus Nitrosothermus koennekii]
MRVTIGHTPDADDAFMFYAMVNNKIEHDLEIEHVIEDIESLNKRALNHELDVTAISVHAYAYTNNYTILRSGSSFGLGYGPIVIAKDDIDLKRARIAIPGRLTSAVLLLKLAIGEFEAEEMRFDQIPYAIIDGKVDAGLIIHELQITYDRYNLKKVLDLGEFWHRETNLPIPLGINVASNKLGLDKIKYIDNTLKRSIQYALSNEDEALEYASRYARGIDKDTLKRFVLMYVNALTIDMGKEGEDAIRKLYSMASNKGFIDKVEVMIA